VVGAIGIIAFVALLIGLLGGGVIKVGGGSDAGGGGGKLPSVSIQGSLACQVNTSPRVNLTQARLSTCVDAKKYAKAKLTQKGKADQWSCLDNLWDHESAWSAWAINLDSGAYGIAQALGHGHVYDEGDWKAQVDWGLDYIDGRGDYKGSPCTAWSLWQSRNPHWY
jgi:hypothetical protein